MYHYTHFIWCWELNLVLHVDGSTPPQPEKDLYLKFYAEF